MLLVCVDKMKLIKEFKNSLLKRKEVELSDSYESNPGLEKARKEVAGHFKVAEDVVVVRKVGSSFGANEFVVEVFIYDSVADKEKIEPKKKEKKGK